MALHTDLAESRAKLTPGLVKNPTIAGEKLNRRWELIDATYVDTLTASVPSTITDPQADGQTYTGTFAVGQEIAQAQDDRSVIVTQELTLINTLTSSISSLQALSPLKTYINDILRAFNLDEGENDIIIFRYLNVNPGSRVIAMAYSDSDLENTLGGSAGSYKDRRFDINDDGTATFTITTEEHNFSNTSGSSPNKVLANTRIFSHGNYDPKNDKSGVSRTKVDGGDGIPVDDIEEIRDNQVAESGFAIRGVSITEHTDGSASLRREQIKKRGTTDQFETQYVPDTGTQEQAQEITWYDLSKTDANLIIADAKTNVNDMNSASYAAAPSGHYLKSISKPIKAGVDSAGDQLFNVVRVTYIPRTSAGSWFGSPSTSHHLFGYRRKSDDNQVGVEAIWTNSITEAETFTQGGDVGGHTKAKAIEEFNDDVPELSGWTDANTTLIGYDGSNHTGVRRLGQGMFKATRVWGQGTPWG